MCLQPFCPYVVAGLPTQRAVMGPVVFQRQGGLLVEQVGRAEVAPILVEDGHVDVRHRKPAQHPDQAQPGLLWTLGPRIREFPSAPSDADDMDSVVRRAPQGGTQLRPGDAEPVDVGQT